jgi:hypothetical protein
MPAGRTKVHFSFHVPSRSLPLLPLVCLTFSLFFLVFFFFFFFSRAQDLLRLHERALTFALLHLAHFFLTFLYFILFY